MLKFKGHTKVLNSEGLKYYHSGPIHFSLGLDVEWTQLSLEVGLYFILSYTLS
jgi:hypothetical protein